MGRGEFRTLRVRVLLAVLMGAVIVLPAASADVAEAPVRGGAHAEYQADVGAILAEASAYDPSFVLDITFTRATLIAFEVPALDPTATRGTPAGTLPDDAPAPGVPTAPGAADPSSLPRVPRVMSVQEMGAGHLTVDPARATSVLLFNDLEGLGLDGLPVAAPGEAAEFVVATAHPLADALRQGHLPLDHHELDVGGVGYAVTGLGLDRPVAASVQGDLFALFAAGAVEARDGVSAALHDLGQRPGGGERLVLIELEGAVARLEASGLSAVLRPIGTGTVGAGAALVADVLGREAGIVHESRVGSDGDRVRVSSTTDLAHDLLGSEPEQGTAAAPAAPMASFVESAGRDAVAAGVALGALAAVAAAGLLAGLGAQGKVGLFGLLAPLYARLQKEEILTNGTREEMFRHIMAHPGVNVSELVKAFGLGWGATVYHLRVLERAHLVVSQKHGRQVCYFQNGGRYKGQMAGISALRNGNAAKVAGAVLARPGLQQRDVCRATQLAQPTVSWHLQRLEEAGLVAGEGGARKRYAPLEALHDLARRGLVPGHDGHEASATLRGMPARTTFQGAAAGKA